MSLSDRSPGRGSVLLMGEITGNDGCVDVIVPLSSRYASTLRTMTASLGVDTGFSVDEIDDFKLALTEAFSMLVTGHAGKRARASFAVAKSELSVRLSLEFGDDIGVEPDELALAILRAVVDTYEIGDSAITLTKNAIESATLG